jgi:electron transfer flavoprotein beta subunit
MLNLKGMRILTLVRQVPDAESSLRIVDDTVDLAQTQLVMDTMDEYGAEEALRLREAAGGIEVIALAVGPAKNEEMLRNALALGADRAIHVKTTEALDPVALSQVVAAVAGAEGVELIFCGGRQSDWDSEALGGAVAERLEWPQLTWTSELALEGNQLSGRHDTDDGSEGFSVALPAVITTQQGLNEPRFPTLPNIIKARKKELRSETIEQYGVAPFVKTIKTELQPRARLREITIAADDPAAAAKKLTDILRARLEGLV